MSYEGKVAPPQYIVTTPSEADAEETRSEQDLECADDGASAGAAATGVGTDVNATSAPGGVRPVAGMFTSQQKIISQRSTQMSSRSFSSASSTSSTILKSASKSLESETNIAKTMLTGAQTTISTQQQQQLSSQVMQTQTQKTVSSSTRSQSLQSSSITSGSDHTSILSQLGGSIGGLGAGNTAAVTQLSGQLKAQSSTSIVASEQRGSHMQKMASTTSSASTKTNFKSFLQQPDTTGHPHSGSFLTAHQKHVRQFVRSTSAHSDATVHPASGSLAGHRPDKCIRSASTQIEDTSSIAETSGETGSVATVSTNKLGLQQSSSILISKSAETIEMKTSSQSQGIRTQLTLSGGLLAPPNRKITILSPIHAPAGLHELLKRSGRSPLSPRISFPGSEVDLFG